MYKSLSFCCEHDPAVPVYISNLFLSIVNYPAHRAEHLKQRGGGLHPPYPCSAFISVHRTGYSAGVFINKWQSCAVRNVQIILSLYQLSCMHIQKPFPLSVSINVCLLWYLQKALWFILSLVFPQNRQYSLRKHGNTISALS